MRPDLIKVAGNFLALAVVLLIGVLALAVVACGGGDATEEAPADSSAQKTSSQTSGSLGANKRFPTTDPRMIAHLEGDINIDGSSTVFPITEAMAEEFGNSTGGNVKITVGVSGTGGGFKKFCAGETVISDASRPIKQNEVELCAENGVEYIELPVAIDGLSVLVNPNNDFVECMTIDELHTIWRPEAEEVITNWNQVRPEWPDRKLGLYAPGVDSGTFDYFTETVNGKSQASRADFLPSEDDNVLVTGIANDQGGAGLLRLCLLRRERRPSEVGRHRRRRRLRTTHRPDHQQRHLLAAVPPPVHLRLLLGPAAGTHQGIRGVLPRHQQPGLHQ